MTTETPDAVTEDGTQSASAPEDETVSTAADTLTEAEGSDSESDPDTFPRSYVEDLREENKRYRHRAQRADSYAHRLHTELVRATGRLADPTDLAFDEAHLDDPDALTAAIDDLVAKKPHLAARRPIGEIGQGATKSADTVNLAALLRQRAQ